MLIIGCDFHTRYQQIAMAEDSTGELLAERRLDHERGEAEAFYRSLQEPVRVGIEATGPMHWFQRLLMELGHELWICDSGKFAEKGTTFRPLRGICDVVAVQSHCRVEERFLSAQADPFTGAKGQEKIGLLRSK